MVGTVLRGRYEITAPLGEGPIFIAYAAKDRALQRDVCLRVLRSPFDRELPFAQALHEVVEQLAVVKHPRVEAIWEIDTFDGTPFLVGELSKGVSLSERIRKLAPFSVPVCVSITVTILEGLEALHAEHMVHGDVSAQSTWIEPDGSARVQLPMIWRAYPSSSTAGSVVLPHMAAYLAPEVSSGASPSHSSDLYSVGVLLYQLLTGRLPYPADTPLSMALKHATEPIPNVRDLNKSIPVVMGEIVNKSLAKVPGARYSSAAEMLSDLRAMQEALRFGKRLSWPIRAESTLDVAQRQVAPKMSAVRVENRRREHGKEWEDDPGDVPGWLRNSLFTVILLVVILVGAFLWSNVSKPKLVAVPNIKNMSSSEARATLSQSHLGLRILGRVSNENVPNDSVVDSSPQPGTKVRESSDVSVHLSSGSRFVEVPDLNGRTVDEARSILGQIDLTLDDRVTDVPASGVTRGTIVRVTPAKGTRVERNTRVNVEVSSGMEPAQHGTPAASDQETKYVYTLKIRLTDLTASAHIRIEITDDYGTRNIFDEERRPGDQIDLSAEGHGKEATFKLYYDDKLIKTVVKQGAVNP